MLKSQKLRGQQKLKYFCQLCRKQCKDQHGWACHITSHSHQGRMREFASNPQQTIQKFSKQFQTGFVQMLRDRYPNIRKKANQLYVQFIDDKNHVHMNATKWDTLTTFCEHLKSYKNIAVEEREQIYLTYLEVDAREFMRKAEASKYVRDREKETGVEWRGLEMQIQRAREREGKRGEGGRREQEGEGEEEEEEEEVPETLSFQINVPKIQVQKRKPVFSNEKIQKEMKETDQEALFPKKKCLNTQKLLTKLKPSEKEPHPWHVEKRQETQEKEQQDEDIPWIMKGIIVKILPHQIDQQYHNKKATVVDIPQQFVARLQYNDIQLQIDQTYLQTVVPKQGSSVMIVIGKHRGQKAIIDRVYPEQGYAVLTFIKDGKQQNVNVACNEFSKLAQ